MLPSLDGTSDFGGVLWEVDPSSQMFEFREIPGNTFGLLLVQIRVIFLTRGLKPNNCRDFVRERALDFSAEFVGRLRLLARTCEDACGLETNDERDDDEDNKHR
jgi:hypothetical protein